MKRIEQLARRTDCVFGPKLQPHLGPVISLGEVFYGIWEEGEDCRVDRLFYGRQKCEHSLWGAAAGLCLLFQGTDFFRWSRLEYRELESFLRTENHQPAFEGASELEKSVQRMLTELKENLLLAHLKSLLERLGKFPMPWEGRHLRNIQSALELQNLVFSPFCQKFGLNWELFSLEGESFIFKGDPMETWEELALGRFIRHVFEKETLKIVAEG